MLTSDKITINTEADIFGIRIVHKVSSLTVAQR